jgi:transcriptional regulator GlxA family with amidase domain
MNRRSPQNRCLAFSAALLGVCLWVALCGPRGSAAPPQSPEKKEGTSDSTEKTRTLGIVLYPQFELLDVYGPAEMFGAVGPRLKVVMVAPTAGPITSAQGSKVVADYGFDNCPDLDLILVPGGRGTIPQLTNKKMLGWLRERADKAEITMSVCSGSALLAKAGLLDGRRATSNKQYFKFAEDNGPKVQWVKQARWVDDGNRVTSSGVSAGMDMALHVIARLYGDERAERIANGTEYQWHRDPNSDPFAKFAK